MIANLIFVCSTVVVAAKLILAGLGKVVLLTEKESISEVEVVIVSKAVLVIEVKIIGAEVSCKGSTCHCEEVKWSLFTC